jgi:proline iminopeptidase
VCSCENAEQQKNSIPLGEGHLAVDGGKIWYKVSGDSNEIPIVLLHGGPGFSSFYLKPFEQLSDSRPVIRYDQLGSGKSDWIQDTTKFTVDRFVQELDQLRLHLGVEKWHILGHSWGSMLAMSYYNSYSDHVASLTLASPCLNSSQWMQSTRELLQQFPDSLKQAVHLADSTGNYETPNYQTAMDLFYAKYVFGATYPQADLDSTMETYSQDVYGYMWGASEFSISGTLSDFNVVPDLPNVDVPVLFTVGEFDEISTGIVNQWKDLTPGSQMVVFEGSSHMTPWNATGESVNAQRTFLNSLTFGE